MSQSPASKSDGKPHGIWPDQTLDERARMDFIKSVRRFMTGQYMPTNRTVFEKRVAPAFEKAHGRPIADKVEMRKAMSADPFFRFYVSARRSGQELMWQYAINSLTRADADMQAAADALPAAGGSLRLAKDMDLPSYATAIDIHCMPGGYERDWEDVPYITGGMYDVGTDAYTMGHLGPRKDMFGKTVAAYAKASFPDLAPARILDMGCAIGSSTTPYVDVFPGAEVHGIDISPGLLRYGHARAQSLGKAVHFSQQSAEKTDFDDASFDLVVSHILFHETSGRAIRNILAECHRLLKPGGVMLHVDMLSYGGKGGDAPNMPLYDQFMFDNETYYNNEPFWMNFRGLDQVALSAEAGFDRDALRIDAFDNALARQVQNTGKSGQATAPAARTGFQILVGQKQAASGRRRAAA